MNLSFIDELTEFEKTIDQMVDGGLTITQIRSELQRYIIRNLQIPPARAMTYTLTIIRLYRALRPDRTLNP